MKESCKIYFFQKAILSSKLQGEWTSWDFFENSHLTCSYQYHITHTKKKLNCDCPPIWDHLNYFCWAEVYRRFSKKFWITLILLNSRPLVNFLDFQRVVWAIALLDCINATFEIADNALLRFQDCRDRSIDLRFM